MQWKTVPCGGRDATFDAFVKARTKRTADIVVLIVDAEEPVASATPDGRVAHLKKRDGWVFEDVDASHVHLMTQCMEAWIVADPDKLEEFYGKGFNEKALPKRQVLDEESKDSLYSALEAATKGTQKGSYRKIKHASEILNRLCPSVVTERCTSFQQLAQWLSAAIEEA
jgi:hypothetical protein